MVTAEEVLRGYSGFGLCRAHAENFPEDVFAIYEPEHGKGHVGVRGLKGRGAQEATRRRKLAMTAEIIRHPDLPLLTQEQRK